MDSRASDVLKTQRYLAAQTLQKADRLQENSPLRRRKSPNALSAAAHNYRQQQPVTPPTQDRSADSCYDSRCDNESSLLRPRRYQPINITELEDEHTIHMQATPQKVSFEPTEMTARSTMDQATRRKLSIDNVAPEIRELLHQSFADEVRELSRKFGPSEELAQGNDSAFLPAADISLPRTADMSKLSSVRESLSSIPQKENRRTSNQPQDFWDMAPPAFDNDSWMQKEMSQLEEEFSFRAAEEEQSRLFADEMAWEQENAVIPVMNVAQQAKNASSNAVVRPKAPRLPSNLRKRVELSCFSGYLVEEDVEPMQATRIEDSSYCSVGEYFNKMSDDLKGMISGSSPPRRTPLPLVDLSNIDESVRNSPANGQKPVNKKKTDSDKENSLSVSSLMKALGMY
ncbi:uncharacterized protein LOC129752099 [Uranotaenia lowii]|uniref:uncharacterized protein LOC129752099 n=1 Tax=Uranotaenia lowii TaxID=190385 RepID=UPI00247A6614|nr:uncharacterized protein LOC129752099 [Uranotaenia lowii]